MWLTMAEKPSYLVEWHWDGDVKVGMLSDGTVVRASGPGALRERIEALLAERGEPGCKLWFTQIAGGRSSSRQRRQ